MGEAITDDVLVETLSVFAGLTARALNDPQVWLGWGDDTPSDASRDTAATVSSLLRRAEEAFSERVRGRIHPASAAWDRLPAGERAQWWVTQMGTLVAFVAATPRFFGVVADRLPVQAAFGAAAQGLTVCAVAREHGVADPNAWVPLLGKVLFDRDLPAGRVAEALARWRLRGRASGVRDADERSADASVRDADAVVRDADAGLPPADDAGEAEAGRIRRAARVVWRLARALLAVEGLLDERPRGKWRYRALGKVPVVGVVGGFLDERGGIRQAAEETVELVQAGHGRSGR